MPEFHFEPSARLQRFLGRELIADPNLAVAELVKNGYDAGAPQVLVAFGTAGRSKDVQIIVVADNGTGMSREVFNENWMRPGFSYKAENRTPPSAAPGPAATIRAQRVPVGEKGLGRLAAARLGDCLEVFTRESQASPWLHVTVDWRDFDTMDRALRDVPISYDEVTPFDDAPFPAGTILIISRLTLDWNGMVPGRKVRGRSDLRLARLREDLTILTEPISRETDDFLLTLQLDATEFAHLSGPIKPAEPELFDYSYEFAVHPHSAGIRISRVIRRGKELADQTGQPLMSREAPLLLPATSATEGTADSSLLRCGPFSGVFYYSPAGATAKRARQLHIPVGVFLYRDKVRVDPYGLDDDWLGAQARKASRQGHAAIQPNYLTGHVDISKACNPNLIDMSNRQGLVENDAFTDFIARVRAEFASFEELVYKEYVEPNWTDPVQRAQESVQDRVSYARALTRSVVHSLRQPVAGLGAERGTLSTLVERVQLPQDVAHSISGALNRMGRHLDDIDETVERLIHIDPDSASGSVSTFSVDSVVAQAIERVGPYATSRGATVHYETPGLFSITGAREVIVEALAELVRNAIEVTRPADRNRDIRIVASRSERWYEIAVTDNGTGIPNAVSRTVLAGMPSTKGRPGNGLRRNNELLAFFGGSYYVENSSDAGSTIALRLPRDSRLR